MSDRKRIIIAGGRDFNNLERLSLEFDGCFPSATHWPSEFEIVSGGAKGADHAGEQLAMSYRIAIKTFPADWDRLGPAAGPIRNAEMAKYADSLIVFWDGKSRGTRSMIQQAMKHRLETHLFFY